MYMYITKLVNVQFSSRVSFYFTGQNEQLTTSLEDATGRCSIVGHYQRMGSCHWLAY